MKKNFDQHFFCTPVIAHCASLFIEMPIAAPLNLTRLIAVTLNLILLLGCSNQQPSPPKEVGRADGTARMASELSAIYEKAMANPAPYFQLNRKRAELLRAQVRQLTGEEALIYRFRLAGELLQAGQTQEAILELEQIIQTISAGHVVITADNKPLFDELALAYLRLAEQENCIEGHSGEACILPIVGAGVHTTHVGLLTSMRTCCGDSRAIWAHVGCST
jgi:hypothetical protein